MTLYYSINRGMYGHVTGGGGRVPVYSSVTGARGERVQVYSLVTCNQGIYSTIFVG
jgi:hypothetical protein